MDDLPTPKSFYDIPGFFWWLDRKVFSAVLESQAESPLATLVELGAYQGRSTVIIGDHLRDGERFVVIDLFGATVDGEGLANRRENERYYKTLTLKQFEHNYLALHDRLPHVVQGLSSEVLEHVEPGAARFVHVDASHLYEHVAVDARSAKTMLRPGGVAVFDDYRQTHTPGVAAAVWGAVHLDGLIPVALTPQKFYGVYSDPDPVADAIREMVAADRRFWSQEIAVMGRPVLRVDMAKQSTKASDTADDETTEKAADQPPAAAAEAAVPAAVDEQPAADPTDAGLLARLGSGVVAKSRHYRARLRTSR